jgi:hypothetical protein
MTITEPKNFPIVHPVYQDEIALAADINDFEERVAFYIQQISARIANRSSREPGYIDNVVLAGCKVDKGVGLIMNPGIVVLTNVIAGTIFNVVACTSSIETDMDVPFAIPPGPAYNDTHYAVVYATIDDAASKITQSRNYKGNVPQNTVVRTGAVLKVGVQFPSAASSFFGYYDAAIPTIVVGQVPLAVVRVPANWVANGSDYSKLVVMDVRPFRTQLMTHPGEYKLNISKDKTFANIATISVGTTENVGLTNKTTLTTNNGVEWLGSKADNGYPSYSKIILSAISYLPNAKGIPALNVFFDDGSFQRKKTLEEGGSLGVSGSAVSVFNTTSTSSLQVLPVYVAKQQGIEAIVIGAKAKIAEPIDSSGLLWGVSTIQQQPPFSIDVLGYLIGYIPILNTADGNDNSLTFPDFTLKNNKITFTTPVGHPYLTGPIKNASNAGISPKPDMVTNPLLWKGSNQGNQYGSLGNTGTIASFVESDVIGPTLNGSYIPSELLCTFRVAVNLEVNILLSSGIQVFNSVMRVISATTGQVLYESLDNLSNTVQTGTVARSLQASFNCKILRRSYGRFKIQYLVQNDASDNVMINIIGTSIVVDLLELEYSTAGEVYL